MSSQAHVAGVGMIPFTKPGANEPYHVMGSEALRRAFLDHAPNWRELRRERGEDMAAVVAAVTAEPFDAAALEAAIGRQEERFRAGLGIGKALRFFFFLAMTPEERRAFARRLQAAHDRDHDED